MVGASNVAIDKNAKIYIAGHRGMVGSAIVRRLQQGGFITLVRRAVSELDETVMDVVDCKVKIVLENSNPDGTLRRLLNVSRLSSLGWKAKAPLREGIA